MSDYSTRTATLRHTGRPTCNASSNSSWQRTATDGLATKPLPTTSLRPGSRHGRRPIQGTSTAEQLAFPDDYSDLTMPIFQEPTPMTTCPRCTTTLRADRTAIGNCYRCGYEDYSAKMRPAPGVTPGSSLAGYKKDGQPTRISPSRYYPPRGLTVVATMDREKAKAKRLERRHQ